MAGVSVDTHALHNKFILFVNSSWVGWPYTQEWFVESIQSGVALFDYQHKVGAYFEVDDNIGGIVLQNLVSV